MTAPPLYHLLDVRYAYDARFALTIPDFRIADGACVGIVGPNGGGKSTLLRLLAFLEVPHQGRIDFDGRDAAGRHPELRRQVTLLLQEPYLLKRSVFENVAYGLRVRGIRKGVRQRVLDALQAVGLPPDQFARRHWYALSGGEAQRVALASRFVLQPRVLIMDEPTASVDHKSAQRLREAVLGARAAYGTTLVICSHDLAWLAGVADEIREVADGRLFPFSRGNLLRGNWQLGPDGLWALPLNDGQAIYGPAAADAGQAAILDPADVVLGLSRPQDMSARNVLLGTLQQLTLEEDPQRLTASVRVADHLLRALVTPRSAAELGLVPGRPVYLIFKCTALRWH